MKLYALDRQVLMPNPHDFIIIGPGRDFQAIRQAFSFNHKRMIACSLKRTGQIGEYPFAIVVDHRGLSMHQLLGLYDLTAVGLTDTLVSETHA